MTIARFGDFAGAVSAHLEAAAVFPDDGLADEPAAAAARQASRLAATLSHYLADIAPYDEVEVLTSERIGGWAQAAVDAREALQVATASLQPADADPVPPDAGPAGDCQGISARRRCRWRPGGTCCGHTSRRAPTALARLSGPRPSPRLR